MLDCLLFAMSGDLLLNFLSQATMRYIQAKFPITLIELYNFVCIMSILFVKFY